MFNVLKVITLPPSAAGDGVSRMVGLLSDAGASLPGVVSAKAGGTLPHGLFGGDLMWRLQFATEADYRMCVASEGWRLAVAPLLAQETGVFVDSVAYPVGRSQVRAQSGDERIWRCLVMAIDPNTPPAVIKQFERDMLLMPKYVSTIGSWALSDVVACEGRRRWTHVWEQEFETPAGLAGEYMLNPIHWGYIDRWYDPESPQRIADIACIIHATIAIDEAVIR